MKKHFIVVAIDGGAASGKSSTSRLLAERYRLMHVDTGSHYRALTFALLKQGLTAESEGIADALASVDIGTSVDGNRARITVASRVPEESDIRSAEVNAAVSLFAAIPAVRSKLLSYQRSQEQVARAHGFSGLIMEGRDIGSVVFPNADFRFFLEADPEKRAQRRAAEGLQDSIAQRDAIDRSRKTAPLVCPTGAERVDTGTIDLETVVAFIGKKLEAVK